MFNENDLDAMTAATGLSEMEVMANESLGEEYILRQRMYHAMGQQGSLPPWMLVDMLRFLGFVPPARKAALKPMEIRWEDVRIGVRVIHTPDETKPERMLYGTFKGKTEPGFIAVLLDGSVGGWVDEFPVRTVALAPKGSPAFVAPEELLVESLKPVVEPQKCSSALSVEPEEVETDERQFDDPLAEVETEAVVVPGVVDRNDPEGRVHVPKMEKDWSTVDPGTRVNFELDGDYVDAEFIEDGPADGHVSIVVDGRTMVVPEHLVEC